MTAGLLDHHKALLAERGITEQAAQARGYSSTMAPGWLRQQGFSVTVSKLGPGLIIPVHDVHGDPAFIQYRPDKPRTGRDGRPVKYETPYRARMVLDVPRSLNGRLENPAVPLWVTEGPLKADAAVSAGLACIATIGVWGWRGTNPKTNGKVAHPDWEYIPLHGRLVYLAPDSDVATNHAVALATSRLGALLTHRGADVRYVNLPALAGGRKVGLDDYLAGGGTVDALIDLADDDPPVITTSTASTPNPGTPSEADAHLHTPPVEAPELAKTLDILRDMVVCTEVCMGLAGEYKTAKLVYLLFTSRLLREPISGVVKGLSSSGKSFTIECIVRLMPPEAYYLMTAMSQHALVYLDEDMRHRTVVLFEAAALRESHEKANEDNVTAYIVRSLLSEGRIEYPTVTKGADGKLTTTKIVREGPTNLVTSTTALNLHPENETRMLSLPSDDSREQTRRVLRAIAGDQKRRDADLAEWLAYQQWLAGANHEVVIPYAKCLAEQIPDNAVRLRRDFTAVLQLIKTHAMMHQLNRDTDLQGRIIADLVDYKAVRSLANDLVAEGIGAGVPATVRETVDLVRELRELPDHSGGVKVAPVAALLKIERSAATRRLQSARDHGYLVNVEDKRGKPARYVPGDPMPGTVAVLPTPKNVCLAHPCAHPCAHPAAQQTRCLCTGVCRCAASSEGVEGTDDDIGEVDDGS